MLTMLVSSASAPLGLTKDFLSHELTAFYEHIAATLEEILNIRGRIDENFNSQPQLVLNHEGLQHLALCTYRVYCFQHLLTITVYGINARHDDAEEKRIVLVLGEEEVDALITEMDVAVRVNFMLVAFAGKPVLY